MLAALMSGMIILLISLGGSGVWIRQRMSRRIACSVARASLGASLFILLFLMRLGLFMLLILPFLLVLLLMLRRVDAGWLLLPFSLPLVVFEGLPGWYALSVSLAVYAFSSALAAGLPWNRVLTRRFAFLALVLLLLLPQLIGYGG